MVRPIVRHHHERLDGRGYPDRLAGDDIPLLARIVTVVDVYDALTNDRPYRSALTVTKALALMRREARAGAYSPDLVERFAALVSEYQLIPSKWRATRGRGPIVRPRAAA